MQKKDLRNVAVLLVITLAINTYWKLCCCLAANWCPILLWLISVCGISQARILEWISIPFSRGSSWPKDWMHVSCVGRWILYHWATRDKSQGQVVLRWTRPNSCCERVHSLLQKSVQGPLFRENDLALVVVCGLILRDLNSWGRQQGHGRIAVHVRRTVQSGRQPGCWVLAGSEGGGRSRWLTENICCLCLLLKP